MYPKSDLKQSFGTYDSRKGLGYGQVSNNFQSPRMLANSFPYKDPDEVEEFEDEVSKDQINSKVPVYRRSDFGAHKSSDPFYFVAGNTKLSDCFFRIDDILSEIESLGDSMSPVPSAYKGPKVAGGSSSYFTAGSYNRLGDTRGFSSAPAPVEDEELDSDQEFYDLFDLSRIFRRSFGE